MDVDPLLFCCLVLLFEMFVGIVTIVTVVTIVADIAVAVAGYVLECARRVTFGVVVLAFRRGRKIPSASPGSHFLS